jgi:hypothetical protein
MRQEKRGSTSPAAAPLLQDSGTFPDFSKIPKPAWMENLALYPKDISKVWTVTLLDMACGAQTAYGSSSFRHVLTGQTRFTLTWYTDPDSMPPATYVSIYANNTLTHNGVELSQITPILCCVQISQPSSTLQQLLLNGHKSAY